MFDIREKLDNLTDLWETMNAKDRLYLKDATNLQQEIIAEFERLNNTLKDCYNQIASLEESEDLLTEEVSRLKARDISSNFEVSKPFIK